MPTRNISIHQLTQPDEWENFEGFGVVSVFSVQYQLRTFTNILKYIHTKQLWNSDQYGETVILYVFIWQNQNEIIIGLMSQIDSGMKMALYSDDLFIQDIIYFTRHYLAQMSVVLMIPNPTKRYHFRKPNST